MEKEKVYLCGGSYDPVGIHHTVLFAELLGNFGKVVAIPCGVRPDKPTVNNIDPTHRASMLAIAVREIAYNIILNFKDLERNQFTPTIEWDTYYRSAGFDPVHVIGSDLLVTRGNHLGVRDWHNGSKLWREGKFLIIPREGYPIDLSVGIPPKAKVIDFGINGASSEIRSLIFQGEAWEHLVPDEVASYIRRRKLYTGFTPPSITPYEISQQKFSISADPYKPLAVDFAKSFPKQHLAEHNPEARIVLGGDGTLLRVIRNTWKERRPYLPVNFGTRGYLTNNIEPGEILSPSFLNSLQARYCPMLYVVAETVDGRTLNGYAFNDLLLTAEMADTIWLDLSINGHLVTSIFGDGMVVCTAAGSTGYYRSAGNSPFEVGAAESLGVCGLNLAWPNYWKGMQIPYDSTVVIESKDKVNDYTLRPVHGFLDGKNGQRLGKVRKVTVRRSGVAAVEVLYSSQYDLTTKLAQSWIPPEQRM